MNLEKGSPAPDFCLPDSSGKMFCLKGFQGKKTLLYFYPKDHTPGCTTEAMEFEEIRPELESFGVQVAGISADSKESHARFALKLKLGFRLLSDPDKTVIQQYGVWQPKKLYGKESMGIVRTTFLISPGGVILEIWNKVKAAGHARAVLDYLKNNP